MVTADAQWLVITDLDGTLLNHHSYDFDAALEPVNELRSRSIPVILNTSKTYAETLAIRTRLGIDDPFVVENGSAIYYPRARFADAPDGCDRRDDYWQYVCGRTQAGISSIIEQLGVTDEDCTRLSRCTPEQAVALTGLTTAQAGQAIAREFSEPLIWHGGADALAGFQQALRQHGLTTLQGGRFLHVIGECDKGRAVQVLTVAYGAHARTIVLGDSANDAAMLAIADIAIIVSSPSSGQLRKLVTPAILTSAPAPQGWAEAIAKALLRIQENRYE